MKCHVLDQQAQTDIRTMEIRRILASSSDDRKKLELIVTPKTNPRFEVTTQPNLNKPAEVAEFNFVELAMNHYNDN